MKKETEKKKISRRQFLGVAAAAGAMTALSGCSVVDEVGGGGWVPTQYRSGAGNWPAQVKGRVPIDPSNPAIVRNDDACIMCGQCAEVCQYTETVFNYYELPIVDSFVCVHCGQCSLWCPSGAIKERDYIAEVKAAIEDPKKVVVIQTSPATRVGIGEEFGMKEGAWAQGKMVAACKELGFDYVHDTNFAADLTIMEEGTELVQRVLGQAHNNTLPQFTSCCPGWVKFVEMYYPDLIPNLSSARSPMEMQGSVLKTYWAKKKGVNPEDVVSVALMPCTAKKFEASRPEFDGAARYYEEYEHTKYEGMKDIDYVLSVRELARMIKAAGINFTALDNDTPYDNILGEGSGAGLIFGNTGGVMEAALRSAYYLIEGENPPEGFFTLKAVRDEDLDGYIDVATVNFPSLGDVSVAVANGLHAARTMCEQVRAGKSNYAFLEVMTCPGGCIAGGGQPRTKVPPDNSLRYNRINTIYEYDKKMSQKHRVSHLNSEVTALYKEFITEGPCSELAELLCHTTYTDRGATLKPISTKKYKDRYLVGGEN